MRTLSLNYRVYMVSPCSSIRFRFKCPDSNNLLSSSRQHDTLLFLTTSSLALTVGLTSSITTFNGLRPFASLTGRIPKALSFLRIASYIAVMSFNGTLLIPLPSRGCGTPTGQLSNMRPFS